MYQDNINMTSVTDKILPFPFESYFFFGLSIHESKSRNSKDITAQIILFTRNSKSIFYSVGNPVLAIYVLVKILSVFILAFYY